MRIGIDGDPLVSRRTGVGQYAAHLVTHLLRVAPEEEYILYRTGRWGASLERGEWGGAIRISSAPKPLLRARSRCDRLDVYHGTNYRLRGVARRGTVLSVHDLALSRVPGLAKRRWRAALAFLKTRRAARLATVVVVGSESAARDLVELAGVPRDKIEVIRYGVSEAFYPEPGAAVREMLQRRYNLPRARYLLFVGTLEPRKNVPTLLRAFSRLPHLRRTHCLVLAGPPAHGVDEIRRVAQTLGLSEAVAMPGYLTVEELRALYSHADCFVYPSLYEGFGLPPLEAMACGAPVIASNASCFPEVLADAAVQVDPRDPAALAAAIAAVVEDESLTSALRDKGFDRVKRFSWERTARQTLEIYRRIGGGAS